MDTVMERQRQHTQLSAIKIRSGLCSFEAGCMLPATGTGMRCKAHSDSPRPMMCRACRVAPADIKSPTRTDLCPTCRIERNATRDELVNRRAKATSTRQATAAQLCRQCRKYPRRSGGYELCTGCINRNRRN